MQRRKLMTGCGMMMLSLWVMSCSQSDALASTDEPGEDMITVNAAAEDATDEGYTGASAVPEGMEIVFEDDFVNTTGEPDPEKWSLCERDEKSTWSRYLSGSYNQAYTKDGSLYLIGEQVDGEYLTGGIETRGKFEFEHGKVECRARFTKMAQGSHEGIWMMPAPPTETWPKSGELDIMEHLNKEDIVYQTVHSYYLDDMSHPETPERYTTAEVNKDDWNIYGVEWNDERIIYTVNGKETLNYPNQHLEGQTGAYQWPFNHPFYLILSISLGGEGTWAGPITDSELPAIFEIDWIRVMQPKSSTNSVPKVTL